MVEVWVHDCESLKPQSCGRGREEVEAERHARHYESPKEEPGGLHIHTHHDANIPGAIFIYFCLKRLISCLINKKQDEYKCVRLSRTEQLVKKCILFE